MAADTVLVTGASGGIGAAVARAFAEAGYRVALHYHTGKQRAEQVAAEVRGARGEAEPFCADLSSRHGVEALRKNVTGWAGGPLAGLVHAAGPVRDRPAISLNEADWDRVIAVHLSAARHLLSAGCIAPGGFALLVGSGAGRSGRAGQAAYAAAKSGLEALAPACSTDDVRVNTIIPGPVETPMWARTPAPAQKRILAEYGLSRPRTPDEVARFIVAIALQSDLSGQTLSMAGRGVP